LTDLIKVFGNIIRKLSPVLLQSVVLYLNGKQEAN